MRLTALSGLAGVGKDLIADHLVAEYGHIKVAQADPLKRIVRDVYRFTEAQLWGPSELRNAPDMRYLRTQHSRHMWKPAPSPEGAARSWVCEQCGRGDKELGDKSRELVGGNECLVYLSPRWALQKLGTEWGRSCYENTWVDLAISTARTLLDPDSGLDYTGPKGLFPMKERREIRGVVITDCRFRNEVDAFRAEPDTQLWRVERPVESKLDALAAAHVSETEQKEIPDSLFQQVLVNDRTIGVLLGHVDRIVNGAHP